MRVLHNPLRPTTLSQNLYPFIVHSTPYPSIESPGGTVMQLGSGEEDQTSRDLLTGGDGKRDGGI